MNKLPDDFNHEEYREIHADLANLNKDILEQHYINHGIKERRRYKIEVKVDSNCNSYVSQEIDKEFENSKIKVIAHYFPQYHVIPENEEWWGKDFTDWTNVKKSKSLFTGHYQPHVPDDYLGYYDLTDIDVQKKQINLAKKYGIYGFCFYAYWFNGKRLLEKPLDNYVTNKDLDLPFCVCWANEDWTRRWDGLDSDVLIKQDYSPEDDISFIEEMSKYLKDSRYIKIGNKPLLMVYRPSILPDPKATAQRWRDWCIDNGIGEIYLVYTQSFSNLDPKEYGFDAASEFPPNCGIIDENIDSHIIAQQRPTPIQPSQSQWSKFLHRDIKTEDYKLFKCIIPSWDSSARKKTRGHVYVDTDPVLFQRSAENVFLHTLKNYSDDERIVFVNAWNEWAEGCHLEPDKKHGYAWLQAIKNAHILTGGVSEAEIQNIKNECKLLLEQRNIKTKPESNEIAIIYHSYFTEYLDETLDYADQVPELHNSWFIITATADKLRISKQIIKNRKNKNFKYIFIETENKGRDILPFFKIYNIIIELGIKVFCKIHSKKSQYSLHDGGLWRTRLISNLINSKNINFILKSLNSQNDVGIMLPEMYTYSSISTECNNPYILEKVNTLADILGVDIANSVFPAGSMFWAKTESLLPIYKIFDLSNPTMYPEETGQLDGTLAHIVERLFCISAQSIGLKTTGLT